MDIGERLLNEPEDSGLNLAGKTPEIVGKIEIDPDFAALGKPLDIPA